MRLPYTQQPTPDAAPADLVLPEPPRRGEVGGPPCGVCEQDEGIWSDENWVLHIPVRGGLPGTVWLASRVHADSFADLPGDLAAEFGRVCARVDAAISSLDGVARTHLYRWGDGGAHFHVWFMPRPAGRLDMVKYALPVWEEVLPPAPEAEHEAAGALIAAAMRRG